MLKKLKLYFFYFSNKKKIQKSLKMSIVEESMNESTLLGSIKNLADQVDFSSYLNILKAYFVIFKE